MADYLDHHAVAVVDLVLDDPRGLAAELLGVPGKALVLVARLLELTGDDARRELETPAVVTEKDALKLLRKAKKEGQLGKKLAKAKAEALAGTAYGPLLPYYLITGGGYLSDEYKLLTVPESQMETAEFYQALEKEELLAVKPEGLVICTCANGDKVLLLHDGTVIRFSHEAPEVCEQWQSLPQFIVDAINEC